MSFALKPSDSPSSCQVDDQPVPQSASGGLHGGDGVSKSSWAITMGVTLDAGEAVLSSAIAGCTTVVEADAELLAPLPSLLAEPTGVLSNGVAAPASTSTMISIDALVPVGRMPPYVQVTRFAVIVQVEPGGG